MAELSAECSFLVSLLWKLSDSRPRTHPKLCRLDCRTVAVRLCRWQTPLRHSSEKFLLCRSSELCIQQSVFFNLLLWARSPALLIPSCSSLARSAILKTCAISSSAYVCLKYITNSAKAMPCRCLYGTSCWLATAACDFPCILSCARPQDMYPAGLVHICVPDYLCHTLQLREESLAGRLQKNKQIGFFVNVWCGFD